VEEVELVVRERVLVLRAAERVVMVKSSYW
jgi:hypothetical protein